jgi:arginine/lysine/ornithine decarboxylase
MALLPLLKKRLGESLFLPAHGRGKALPDEFKRLLRQRAGVWDLPELAEIGGPLEPEGAVGDSQRESAAAMGADHCWYGVNGATGLLQAALLAIAEPGDAVLMPRNVHRSLIQACVLGDITPLLYNVPYQTTQGHPAPPDLNWIKRVIAGLPSDRQKIKAAVLVHPTYQGYANNPKEIIKYLQAAGFAVLVDEAHGSHFAADVDPDIPPSALHCEADLVVHSLHKSAAGLAQTAVLWMRGQRVDPERIERCLGWLQTTSPSALLLASCESAIHEWTNNQGKQKLRRRIDEGRLLTTRLTKAGLPIIPTQDPLRLILHTGLIGLSGIDADNIFINNGLIAELPEPGTLTFCLGLSRHKGLDKQFRRTWERIKKTKDNQSPQPDFTAPPLPLIGQAEIKLSSAWGASSNVVSLADAEGEIASELTCPYPPGIPLLIPGEKIDFSRAQWLIKQRLLWKDAIPERIKVMKKTAT